MQTHTASVGSYCTCADVWRPFRQNQFGDDICLTSVQYCELPQLYTVISTHISYLLAGVLRPASLGFNLGFCVFFFLTTAVLLFYGLFFFVFVCIFSLGCFVPVCLSGAVDFLALKTTLLLCVLLSGTLNYWCCLQWKLGTDAGTGSIVGWMKRNIHCLKKTTLKNDTDVTHYRFNPHQPILVIFGRDVAERVCYWMVIYYPASPN